MLLRLKVEGNGEAKSMEGIVLYELLFQIGLYLLRPCADQSGHAVRHATDEGAAKSHLFFLQYF